jgi:hypothetical protein
MLEHLPETFPERNKRQIGGECSAFVGKRASGGSLAGVGIFPIDDYARPEELDHIDMNELRDHDVLRIKAQNGDYQIRVISIRSRQVLVLGGPFFENWTLVKLTGTAVKHSFWYDSGIFTGRRIVFTAKDRTIMTSLVLSIVLFR